MSETLKKIDNYKKKELPTFFYNEFIIICNIQIGAGRRGSQSEETLKRTLHIVGGRNPFHSYGTKIRSTLQNLGICILN
jgi:hypothetical protein